MQAMRLAALTLGLLLPAASSPAQDEKEKQEVQITGIAGWGGLATRGDWTPALIDLDNRGKKDLQLTLSVTWAAGYSYQSSANPTLDSIFGRAGVVHQVPVSLPARSRKRVSLSLLTPEGPGSSVWAFAQDAPSGRTLARGELAVRLADAQRRLIGIVGQSRPEGLEDDHLSVATLQADELPEDWQGYSSLQALIWLDGRATELRSAAQLDALRRWISGGGRFYVARANTLSFSGTPIAELLPVKLGAGRELEGLGDPRFPEGALLVLENTRRRGVIRAAAQDLPLVTEAPQDGGLITFIAFDPTHPPFTKSIRSKAFWQWLLKLGPPPPAEHVEEERPPAVIGSLAISQYAGRFPDIAAPEIGGLFLLIILYLVVVGPLDYLLLRWLRRLEYTWFTFPAYVVLFTLFILVVGGAFIQRAAHQREIVVEDHYPDTGFLRRRALSAVLAPADVIYKVEDAEPISSNYINQRQALDTGGKITDIEVHPGPVPLVTNWLLNRNFTGLAYSDRCDSAPAAVTYSILSQDSVEVRLQVKNTTAETFEGSTLVTSKGIFWISSIPPGQASISGSRTAATVKQYVEQEGQHPVGRPRGGRRSAPEIPGAVTETDLNPAVRKALISASFGVDGPEAESTSGLARGLQTRRWLDSGGSVLCTWPQTTGPVVRFDPKPGRYTAVTLHRYFQGPPP